MLIDEEQDERALLRAEDEAIREVEQPKEVETVEDIAALIERITRGDAETVQQG